MLRYSAGSWHAVVAPGGVALLAPDVEASVLEGMWTAMGSNDGLGAVLETLVGAFGTSLGSLPSFAVAIYDESALEVRVMVRGPVNASVASAGSPLQQISGLGVTTWSERVVGDPSVIELTGAVESPVELPIRDGVVAAGRIRWIVSEQGEGAALVDSAFDADDPVFVQPVQPVQPVPPVAPMQTAVPVEAQETTPPTPPAPLAPPAPPVAVVAETMVPPVDHTHAEAPISVPTVEPVTGVALPSAASGEPVSEDTTGYDDLLFGETRMSTVEDAAVRVAEESLEEAAPSAVTPVSGLISGIPTISSSPRSPSIPAPPRQPEPQPVQGDHDGETISAARLAELQAQIAAAAPSAPPGTARPVSSASNPATLIVSTGERIGLERGAVIGRRPRAMRSTGTIPHLVTVPSPSQDISRSHVELRFEAGDIVATDLDTTNGTRLLRVGAEPVRLHPGESVLLVPGDRLDIGDDIVLSFEGLR